MTTPPQNIFSAAPFRSTAKEYISKGWDVLPLPHKRKEPPPPGFTGRIAKGKYPTPEQVAAWMTHPKAAKGNIAVRPGRPINIDGLAYEAIGIDVDDYGGKSGYSNFADLEESYGKFPDTWISSARNDCRSGIRWVLVPAGFEYRGQAAPSIEVVQHIHRYGVVFPSYNPDSQSHYCWYAPGMVPNGKNFSKTIPAVEDLAFLPKTWWEHLKKGVLSAGAEAVDDTSTTLQLQQWFENTCGDPNMMCRTMKRALAKRIETIRTSGDHHDPLVLGHMNLFLLAIEGHIGWRAAVVAMEKAWLARLEDEADSGNRTLWVAKAELIRSRIGAMQKIKGRVDAGILSVAKKDTCALKKRNVLIDEQFTKGQVSLALLFERTFAGKLIFVPNVGWHIWDGKRWKEDTKSVVTQYVIRTMNQALKIQLQKRQQADQATTDAMRDKLLEQADKIMSDVSACQSASAMDGIKRIASTLPEIATDTSKLDNDPYLLNLQNGTLNLKTGELQKHNPHDFITKVCGGEFDPQMKFDATVHCPEWNKFLGEVLPDADTREFLAQLMGVSLVGTQLEHMLLILHGNGRNGKGAFERAMRNAMGDYGVSAASDLFTAHAGAHTTSQTDLMGKRLAVIDETESNAKLSESLVKKMTGGGEHTARRMHQNNIRFPMTWLAMMITNHLPGITGTSAAMWDRLIVIKFPVYFSPDKQKKQLDEVLAAEANGILMWAYAAWQRYCAAGQKLELPQSVIDEVEEYRHTQDKLQMWIDKRCDMGVGDLYKTRTRELLEDYSVWRLKEGGEQLGTQKFLQALREKNIGYERKTARVVGLRLKPSNDNILAKSDEK